MSLLAVNEVVVMVRGDHNVDPSLLDIPEIAALDDLISSSYLLRHDFLRCFEMGGFKNMTAAASVFASEHYVYSKNFIDYLQTVAAKIDEESVRAPILENIHEEQGNYEQDDIDTLSAMGIDEEWYNRIPHKLLSQRFFESLGIEAAAIPSIDDLEESEGDGAGVVFTKFMLSLYSTSNVCDSLAVIGFAIEETVSRLYEFIWNGLQHHTPLTGDQIVFFPLHILIDDGHADLLKLGFKHYVESDPAMCSNAVAVVNQVLAMRIKMYDDIRKDIERRQGHQCPLPYGPQPEDAHVPSEADPLEEEEVVMEDEEIRLDDESTEPEEHDEL